MKKHEEAKELFESGLNCAQSVFAAFAPDYGIPKNLALKTTTGFPAGLCYRGELCGAIVGAYLALGMKHGYAPGDDKSNNAKTHDLIKKLNAKFEKEMGSVQCKEILGYDASVEEELKKAREVNIFKTKCPVAVETAARIVEELL